MNPKVRYSHEVAPAKETCVRNWIRADLGRVPPGEAVTAQRGRTAAITTKTLRRCLNKEFLIIKSHECFMRGRRISGDKPCYGYRPIVRFPVMLLQVGC